MAALDLEPVEKLDLEPVLDLEPIDQPAPEPPPTPSLRPAIPAPGTSPSLSLTAPLSPFDLAQPPGAPERLAAAAATPAEQATTKTLTTPLLNLPPELYASPALTAVSPAAARGLAGFTKENVEGLTSPAGLATLPYMAVGGAESAALKGAGMATRAIAGAFGAQGAEGLVKTSPEFVDAVKRGDIEAAAKSGAETLLNAAMVAGGVGALRGKLATAEADKPPLLPQTKAALNETKSAPEKTKAPAPETPPNLDLTPIEAPPTQELPPVPEGHVRFYHGGIPGTGARDITPYYAYAKGYANKSNGGVVQYVDIPKDAPFLHKIADDTGLGYELPYGNATAPAEVMANAKIIAGSETTRPIESEVSNASPNEEAAAVYGDLQPQSLEGQGEVSAEEGGAGVQPQTAGGLSPRPSEPPAEPPAQAELLGDVGQVEGDPQNAPEPSETDQNLGDSTQNEPPSVGPGAASPSDFPKEPEIKQLTEAIRGTIPVRQPFLTRIGNELKTVRGQVAAAAENAVTNLKDLGARALANLKGEHVWTDFKEALGKFSGDRNRNDYELQRFTKTMRDVVPDKLRREAIVNWIQADGDKALLDSRAKASKPLHRRGYEIAQELTPDEQALAQNVRSYLDAKLKEGIDAGLLKAGVENYVSQLWDRPNPISNKLMGEAASGKLAPNFKFARKRIFDSYFEGEQAGFKPKIKDIGALVATYDQAFSKAIASRNLIKAMHEGLATDGRPLVEVSGTSSLVAEGGTPEALLIKPKAKPEDIGDYRPIDHPALRGWKWAGTDPETGAPILFQGDLLVHPEVYQHLKNVLSSSALRKNAVFRTILNTGGLLKQSKLALSGFHFTQEGTHAAAHRVNPLAPIKIDFSDLNQSALVDHGLQVADYRAYQAFSEGLSGAGSLYERIPGIGKYLTRYNEFLFQEYIPRLKMSMATDALERNRARFKGKLSDDQILELTANQANAAFGELNYAMLGRNQTLQDFFRLAALAPDFLEARGRFAAQALTKTGTEQRVALALQAVTLYVAARILNQALDNDPHWEPKYAFSILANKRQYGIRSVVEDTMHAVTDPSRFIANRLAPFAKGVTEFVTGRNWRGIKRSSVEQLQDLADWLLPITADKQPQSTRTDQALSASGVTVRAATASQRLYDKLGKFMEENSLMTAEKKAGLNAPSEYATLRNALQAGDEKAAEEEYSKLLHPTDGTKPKTVAQVRAHFANSVSAPFSGSTSIDQRFLKSLDEKDRALYQEARSERREIAQKFRALPTPK